MRYQNWPEILAEKVQESHSTPFTWGSHDCCLFAADVVLAMTGVDHAEGVRETYDSALGAAKELKKRGGVRGIANAAFGTEIHPMTAQRGDVVVVPTGHGEALGVCLGAHCLVPGAEGLVSAPISAALTAWRVS